VCVGGRTSGRISTRLRIVPAARYRALQDDEFI
jgi:hypothetical protein